MENGTNGPILGARTFFASAHAIDVCGINGLPLTPNSIRILGRFQKLKLLIHPNLCAYLDAQRGKHERITVVCEFYSDNLQNMKMAPIKSCDVLTSLAFECLDALIYLHQHNIIHRCLSPQNIHFNSEGNVKISNFGLFYITEGGSTVSFPIGVPKYMAPEVLVNSAFHSSSKCDVWSLGMILLESALNVRFWNDSSLTDIFGDLLSLITCETGADVVSRILHLHNSFNFFKNLPLNMQDFIEKCLTPNPIKRPEAQSLLSCPLFHEYKRKSDFMEENPALSFLSTQLRLSCIKDENKDFPLIVNHLSERPTCEAYYLWQLAGGDLESELRRQELIKAKAPVITISKIIVGEGEEFGLKRDRAYLLDDSVSNLPLEPLKFRLRDMDPDVYYPLVEYSLSVSHASIIAVKETTKLPLLIKEKDVEYQLYRNVLFRKLLAAYPYKRTQIHQEARLDVSPLYRPLIWATLLEIEGDVQAIYASIDKETPIPTDRQIEVDIPRCHQYDELLSSPVGHRKFKRILKAWVVSHPQYVYWQGLDSLCAPFLSLNFNNEALAYACLTAFIPKYVHNFFLKDNSAVIQEYLAKFSHLIAFHDPVLTNHLDSIGFIPELYAIPWFLTMYTHVFPLHKIFHLWDTLLLGQSSFPLCIGVAILKQLRNNLLSYGFNECILMFSDMPEIDIQRCVQDSIKIFCSTPKSITYRSHDNFNKLRTLSIGNNVEFSSHNFNSNSDLVITPLPIHELKSESCPRISAEDLLDLMDVGHTSRNKSRSQSLKLLIIDIRTNEEYCKGALHRSINIPFTMAMDSDEHLENPIIDCYKGKIIVVIGSNKNNFSSKFASKLVKLCYSHVCTLHGGVEALRKTGLLIAKTTED